jgi:hypothetical protein
LVEPSPVRPARRRRRSSRRSVLLTALTVAASPWPRLRIHRQADRSSGEFAYHAAPPIAEDALTARDTGPQSLCSTAARRRGQSAAVPLSSRTALLAPRGFRLRPVGDGKLRVQPLTAHSSSAEPHMIRPWHCADLPECFSTWAGWCCAPDPTPPNAVAARSNGRHRGRDTFLQREGLEPGGRDRPRHR